MEDVLGLPHVPSWTLLLWVGAEHSQHRKAPLPFVLVAPGWQLPKGSDARESSPKGGTEDEAPLSPSRWQQVGQIRGLFLAA